MAILSTCSSPMSMSGPETVAAYQAQWDLNGSLAARFGRWLAGFVTFDWGVSFETGRPVMADFAARLPYSAAIGFEVLQRFCLPPVECCLETRPSQAAKSRPRRN